MKFLALVKFRITYFFPMFFSIFAEFRIQNDGRLEFRPRANVLENWFRIDRRFGELVNGTRRLRSSFAYQFSVVISEFGSVPPFGYPIMRGHTINKLPILRTSKSRSA